MVEFGRLHSRNAYGIVNMVWPCLGRSGLLEALASSLPVWSSLRCGALLLLRSLLRGGLAVVVLDYVVVAVAVAKDLTSLK